MGETMAAAKEDKCSIKVLINKDTSNVLFAEVGSDFADILISFLTLPLGTIVRLLAKHYGDKAPVIGSLSNLYESLENLDVKNFSTETGKLMLLNTRNPFEAHLEKLKINIDDTEPTKYFICNNSSCVMDKDLANVAMYYGATECECGMLLCREISLSSSHEDQVGPGVFTEENAYFILNDDLQLMPNSFGLHVLDNCGIDGIHEVEERTIVVGFGEIMDLLKGSLISKTPLTDLIFPKTSTTPLIVNSQCGTFTGKNATASAFKKMTVKAVVQKSTGKILLAQDPKDQESYIKGPAMFSVTDDLVVKPTSAISGLSTLKSLETPRNDMEEHVIDIGIEEALTMLNASIFSNSALNNSLKTLLRRQPKEEK